MIVVARRLVRAQRDAMPAWDRFHHRHGRLWFRTAGGLGHAAVDRDAVAVLHQHVAGIAELGLLARALAGQAGLGIGGRLVGEVAAPLAVKVDSWDCRDGVGWPGLSLRLKLLCPANASISVPSIAGLVNHAAKKAAATSPSSSARGSW
jgi:hypothetical protein